MGGGLVCYRLGSGMPQQREPRERSWPQERQVTIIGEGRGEGVDHHRKLPAHFPPEHACVPVGSLRGQGGSGAHSV